MSVRVSSGLIVASALLTWAPSVRAHDGHGNPEWFGSILHYLFEPAHLLLPLTVIVALLLAAKWISCSRSRGQPARRP